MTNDNSHLKACTKCLIDKNIGDFHIDKKNKTGRSTRCKKCAYECAVKWKKDNPEKTKASRAKRWIKNKERLKANGKKWREKNKTKIKEKIKTPLNRYNSLKSRAKQKGLEFDIPYDKYLEIIQSKCYYDKEELPLAGCGLDRVDSSQGYILSNVVPCCKNCNQAKNDRTQEEFIKHCLAVIQNAKLKTPLQGYQYE